MAKLTFLNVPYDITNHYFCVQVDLMTYVTVLYLMAFVTVTIRNINVLIHPSPDFAFQLSFKALL